MDIRPTSSPSHLGKRLLALLSLCCLALVLASCSGARGGGKKTAVPANPNEKMTAYGVSVTLPSSWSLVGSITPEMASKETLDARRQQEPVLLLEAVGPMGPQGMGSLLGVFLVTADGMFMPRDYAEKLQPHEFEALGKDLLKREKAEAKKRKAKSGLLDVQISRETVNGKTAIVQRLLGAGPDGRPLRFINWEIYLDNGAGIGVKTISDPEQPGAENEVVNTVRSLRIQ